MKRPGFLMLWSPILDFILYFLHFLLGLVEIVVQRLRILEASIILLLPCSVHVEIFSGATFHVRPEPHLSASAYEKTRDQHFLTHQQRIQQYDSTLPYMYPLPLVGIFENMLHAVNVIRLNLSSFRRLVIANHAGIAMNSWLAAAFRDGRLVA